MQTQRKYLLLFSFSIMVMFVFPILLESASKKDSKVKEELSLPKNVRSILKANSYPNASEEMTVVEPSSFTKQLLESAEEKIENPEMIQLLNESAVKTTPFSIGYDAHIYLGRWPLSYESESSSIIWDYEHINTNELNNRNSDEAQELTYIQQKEQTVKGALMNKIDHPDMIKKLMLATIANKADFPVAFSVKVGENTKLKDQYNVGAKKIGSLDAYVPAVNEKGQAIYGDVYIQSKGSQVSLQVKNVTKHGIGAWIPIQDHVSLTYTVK